jgi:hypothetical protein
VQTDQATLVLGSLLRGPRRFQSHDLAAGARKRLFALESVVEAFAAFAQAPDPGQALTKLEEAYRMLGAVPPNAGADDVVARRHPALVAADQPDRDAETAAWHALLAEAPESP